VDVSQIDFSVGTGVDVPAKEAENLKPKPEKADHYMKISATKMVAATCK
jgi:hypothetical protein